MKTIVFAIFLSMSLISIGQTNDNRMIFSDFTEGVVYFKDGTRTAAFLNYDTYEEEMIFKNGNEVLALASPELIASIKIEDRIFEWLEGDVFLERLDSTPVLIYKRNRNQLISKGKGTAFGGVSNTSSVQPVNNLPRGYDKQTSELTINEDFELKPDNLYYAKEKTSFRSLTSQNEFCKVFGGNKKEVAKFIKTEKLNMQDLNDVIKIIEYCKNNQ